MPDGYNERLFSGGGLRQYLHTARYRWLRESVRRLATPAQSVFELGCFDAKALDWFDRFPERYLGVDANWEGGLELARERFGNDPRVGLLEISEPAQLADLDEKFDLVVSMETLEHVPPEMVEPYLRLLSRLSGGFCLITVPNEKGIVFGAKWLAKRILHNAPDAYSYSLSEYINAVLGRMSRVSRSQHKGFDYDEMTAQVSKHFHVERVEAIPFSSMPLWLSFGVGIVARPRS